MKRLKTCMNFEYLGVISSGAYGKVYAVREESTKSIRALKILIRNENEKECSFEDFVLVSLREILFGSYLLNMAFKGFVMNLSDSGTYTAGFVQRYAKCTLTSVWPLSVNQVRHLFKDICIQVLTLHTKGIFHRDIKPENILVNFDSTLLLIDTSLSIRSESAVNSNCVTLWYRSPEILLKQKYFHAADVWSLGITILDSLRGKPLYKGTTNVTQALARTARVFGVCSTDPEYYVTKFDRLMDGSMETFCDDVLLNDLLSRMIVVDDRARLTIKEVLQHPFWEGPMEKIPIGDEHEFVFQPLSNPLPPLDSFYMCKCVNGSIPMNSCFTPTERVIILRRFLQVTKKKGASLRCTITAFYFWDFCFTRYKYLNSSLIEIAALFVAFALDADDNDLELASLNAIYGTSFSRMELVDAIRYILIVMECGFPDVLVLSNVLGQSNHIFYLAVNPDLWTYPDEFLQEFIQHIQNDTNSIRREKQKLFNTFQEAFENHKPLIYA